MYTPACMCVCVHPCIYYSLESECPTLLSAASGLPVGPFLSFVVLGSVENYPIPGTQYPKP